MIFHMLGHGNLDVELRISDKEFIFNTLDDQNYLVSKSINYENNSENFILFHFFQYQIIVNTQ